MKYLFLSILNLCCFSSVSAQFDHIDVFPDLDGTELYEAVIQEFKPSVVLTYSQARDTLYANIDVRNDSIECVYTGHKLYLDPTMDPTQALAMGGDPNGINTEHTYPQSKGADEGFARSDMHHLYPTRIKANSDRGSLPFGDIPDAQTDTWYFLTQEQSSIPGSNIDSYSEGTDEMFEPRESHKGDVARSMMYFYTMYRDRALDADPEYFNIQKDILCQWHYDDVVDEKEWNRSQEIAAYQDGKPNPFVLDCTLAARMYCLEASPECRITNVDPVQMALINIYPNPGITELNITSSDQDLTFEIYSTLGQKVIEGTMSAETIQVNIANWNSGMYMLKVVSLINHQSQTFPFIKK